ncbi:MAG: FtsX-like permease family protein [Chryseolinea sp.]
MKQKLNFIFKLIGLTTALFCLLIITVYLAFQFSFDKFHDDYKNVCRVNSIRAENEVLKQYATVPLAVGPILMESFQQVISFARIDLGGSVSVNYNGQQHEIAKMVGADSSVFNVLTFQFIHGDKHALERPGSLVLTETIAKAIFGDVDPMHKLITFTEQANAIYEVTAVIADLPENSHLYAHAFRQLDAQSTPDANKIEVSWDGSVFLYVRLAANENMTTLATNVSKVMRNHHDENADGADSKFGIFFQPIADVYLGPSMSMNFFMKVGNPLFVKVFLILGIFLIIVSVINYTILSIADFESRMKEISVRKIMGASRQQISLQAIIETTFISGLSLIIATILLYILSPTISTLTEVAFTLDTIFQRQNVLLILSMVALLIVTSSAYPAFKLSSQRPLADIVSNELLSRTGKALLTVQFSISIFCICVTMVVGKQLNLFKHSDIGYDRSNLVQLDIPDTHIMDKAMALKNEIDKLAGVSSSSITHYPVVSPYFKDRYDVEVNGEKTTRLINEVFVDYDYFKTLNITLLSGRNFNITSLSDPTTAYIINETAAKEFGWNDPIGKKIKYHDNRVEGYVIGLVKDYNIMSLHDPIEPLVIRLPYDEWPGQRLVVRVIGDMKQVIPKILSIYQSVIPGSIPSYSIVDDVYNSNYRRESKAFESMKVAAIVIALISIVGIFSISIYISGRRMKEYGIRKILGATITRIAGLQTLYFVRIAFVSMIIGLSLSYWLMNDWLSEYAYRISLDATLFLQSAFLLFAMVFVASGYSAWRAGTMDPLKVIKTN